MDLKRCIQCGILRNVDDYRKYAYATAHGTDGRYRVCRDCESLNSTFSKLIKIPEPDRETMNKIRDIKEIYEACEKAGYRVPTAYNKWRSAATGKNDTSLDRLRKFYNGEVDEDERTKVLIAPQSTVASSVDANEVPTELSDWLAGTLTDWEKRNIAPMYLQETVYPALREKYRPSVGFDNARAVVLYDDTYKSILNLIIKKFDDYEDYIASKTQAETEDVEHERKKE